MLRSYIGDPVCKTRAFDPKTLHHHHHPTIIITTSARRSFASTPTCLKRNKQTRPRTVEPSYRFLRPLRLPRTTWHIVQKTTSKTTRLWQQTRIRRSSPHRLTLRVLGEACPAPADPVISVRSWKMAEYKSTTPSRCPFRRLRGASRELPDAGAEEGEGRGAEQEKALDRGTRVRGYDKFFNIGEVPWTEVCCFFCWSLLGS